MPSGGIDMDRQEVAQTLYYAAASRAIGLGFRLGPGADQYFRDRSDETAREIVKANRAAEKISADLTRAVRNFQLLVDTMIAERRNAYADDSTRLMSDEIGERTLSAALAKVCPLWPFCK